MATTSPTLHHLIDRLRQDFPRYQFQIGDTDNWSPSDQTITVHPDTSPAHLLHELAHAVLQHRVFTRDVELLEMERAAWHHAATTLAPRYRISLAMEDDMVQDALDTYRHWLSARSTCPYCGAIGLQATATTYRCLHCQERWHVNEARTCRLQRTKLLSLT